MITVCGKGHPYDEANTYVTPKGLRLCRACNLLRVRAYQARRKDRVSESRRRWNERNREKWVAYREVEKAIKRGTLIRPDACSSCGETGGRIHAHHTDHSKPLDVQWLCPLCHGAAHRRERAAA